MTMPDENSAPELKNKPNGIVCLTELHEKSIENQLSGGHKSYDIRVVVYLHFLTSFLEQMCCLEFFIS
jgi:hypothetical protein